MEAGTSKLVWPTFTVTIEPPILGYPDYTLEFILHVDGSAKELSVVLLEYQENELKVLGYRRPSLTPAEKKCHNFKLFWLLNVKLVTIYYLYFATHFKVFTDKNPVTYITTTGRLSAAGQMWVSE